MKVLFIGDPHLKINRFDLALQFLDWVTKLIEKEKPQLVVNLGDTFDTHAVLRSEVTGEFMKHVYATIKTGAEYVYLIGNHDMYKPNDAKYHAMMSYKDKIQGLTVIDTIRELHGMTFVPYQVNPDNFPKHTLPICVAHQTFIGADYGPIAAKEGVDPKSIAGAEIIISGHIHKRSTLDEGRIRYYGSPFSQSVGDVDQVKGITIFDTVTYGEKFIETPLPTWRRIRGMVSELCSIQVIHEEILEKIPGSKDHWVIELEGPKAEVVGYLDSAEYKEAIGKVDVKVKTKYTDKEKKKVSIEAKSMDHIISEFVTKVYNGTIDKNILAETAKTILNESRLVK